MIVNFMNFWWLLFFPLLGFAHPVTKNFDKGKELMQIYEKPALLCFISSDSCPWSCRFFDDILSQPKFFEEMNNRFIFIVLDFPETKRQSKEQVETNATLKMLYRVDSFPSFVMVKEDGEEITRLSFLSEKYSEFSKKMLFLEKEYLSLKKDCQDPLLLSSERDLKILYQRALSLGSPSLANQILEQGLLFDHSGFFLVEKFIALSMTKEGKQSDEAKQLRTKIQQLEGIELEKAKFRLAVSDFQDLQKNDPDLAGSVIVRFLSSQPEDKEMVYQLNFLLATHFLKQKDFALARHYVEEMNVLAHTLSAKESVEQLAKEIEKQSAENFLP